MFSGFHENYFLYFKGLQGGFFELSNLKTNSAFSSVLELTEFGEKF